MGYKFFYWIVYRIGHCSRFEMVVGEITGYLETETLQEARKAALNKAIEIYEQQ